MRIQLYHRSGSVFGEPRSRSGDVSGVPKPRAALKAAAADSDDADYQIEDEDSIDLGQGWLTHGAAANTVVAPDVGHGGDEESERHRRHLDLNRRGVCSIIKMDEI